MVEKAAGIKFKYVSYDGLAPRMNALLGGHIDLTDSNLTQKGKVDAGLLHFLAIASEKRDPEMPDVPTLEGARLQYRLRGRARPPGPEGHAGAGARPSSRKPAPRLPRSRSFAQAMKLQGTRVAFLNAKDYAAFLDKIDAENKAIMADLGLDEEMSLGRDGIAGLILLAISLALSRPVLQPALSAARAGRAGFLSAHRAGVPGGRERRCSSSRTWRKRARPGRRRRRHAARLSAGRCCVRASSAVYVALLPLLGFRIATALFVAALQAVLEPAASAAPMGGARSDRACARRPSTYLVFERYLHGAPAARHLDQLVTMLDLLGHGLVTIAAVEVPAAAVSRHPRRASSAAPFPA